MTEPTKLPDDYRHRRIERLLRELRYEFERGFIENEIDENYTYRFIFPRSRKLDDGVILCEFRTKPTSRYNIIGASTDWNQI